MRAYLLLLLLLSFSGIFLAQRPDSVQLNGEWYFIYPLEEASTPSYSFMKRTDLSEKQFDVLLQWKLAKDPRATLRHSQLEDSLNAELLRTNRILSKEQDPNSWEEGTEPPYMWGYYKKKKRLMRRFPAINVEENNPATYDLVPSVSSLPDGKYIQYFEPFLTYDNWKKMQVISGKTAAVFSLKDNLLNGEYTRYNYNGDTIKHGTFADGLKDGTWLVCTSFDYHEGKSKNTLEITGPKMEIDLKEGIPNGNYRASNGNYSESTGQYRNGFAYGTWKMRSGGETLIYQHIVDGKEWIADTTEVLAVVSGERARSAKGFDFSEWKGHFGRPDYHEEFVVKRSIQLKPKAINDFGSLMYDPICGSNLTYQRSGYFEYNNTGKVVRFSGSRETYIDDWLMERVTFDPLTHALNYSRYYENGHLFDTMEFRLADSLFHYHMYDVNGKLYLENTYDTDGNLVDRNCYATFKVKQPKAVKQPKFTHIEGFPVYVDRSYYENYNKVDYFWNNANDSVIDGKKYEYIAWDYDTKKRVQEAYYSEDTLHQLYYNKWGKQAFEKESVREDKSVSGIVYEIDREVKYTSYWDDWKWCASRDTSGFFQVKLYKNEQLFSGNLKIQYNRKKVQKAYSGGANQLVLTLPRYYYSRKMSDRFLDVELFPIEADDYQSKNNRSYRDKPSSFTQLLSLHLSEHLMAPLNQKELVGAITNGVPSGDWTSYSRNGEKTTQLSFTEGLASGNVKHFREYRKPNRYDRRWKENDRYYYQKFSDKNSDYYIGTEYNLKNGMYDGLYEERGVNGDVLLQLTYRNNNPVGPLMRTFDGDTLTGNYRNGLAQGNFLYRVDHYSQTDTALFMQFADGKLNGDYVLFQNDFYNENSMDLVWNSERDKTDIQALRAKFKDDKPAGRMVLYDFDKQPRYGITFRKLKPDTLFFYENGEVSYYFERVDSIIPPLVDSVFLIRLDEKKTAKQAISTAHFLVDNPLNPGTESYQYWLSNIGKDIEELKIGNLTKLYPNSKVARTGYRLFNKSMGLWKFYGYEGNLLYTIDYDNGNGGEGAIGLYTEYASDGSIVSKRYVVEELEKYDCSHSDYYAIRQFIVFEDPKDSIDRSNGLQKNYFDNGVQMSEGNLKNGLPDGVWKFFTPDGRLTIVGKYANGKKEGRWLYGDLGDKKYIGEICLNPDDPFLDFHIAELEKKKDIQVEIYKEGKAIISQFHELNDK